MKESLKDKRVLIVGGSSGLGLAVAIKAFRAGAKVIIASRSAAQRHDELVTEVGPNIETISFDVASIEKVEKAVLDIGNIDHLVVTTRADINPGPMIETDAAQAEKAFNVKFWGQYRLIQKAYSNISQSGSIIMTSGIAGEKIFKNYSSMAVINSATETLGRVLAVELAPIRVNVVSPGFVAPKSEDVENYSRQFPCGRIAEPAEVAGAYIDLMMNSYITGHSLVVDGGARLI